MSSPFFKGGIGAMQGSFSQINDRPPISKLATRPSALTETLTNQEACAIDATCNKRYTAATVRFGGGIDLYVTEHILANFTVDYVFPTGQLYTELDYVSLQFGLDYRF